MRKILFLTTAIYLSSTVIYAAEQDVGAAGGGGSSGGEAVVREVTYGAAAAALEHEVERQTAQAQAAVKPVADASEQLVAAFRIQDAAIEEGMREQFRQNLQDFRERRLMLAALIHEINAKLATFSRVEVGAEQPAGSFAVPCGDGEDNIVVGDEAVARLVEILVKAVPTFQPVLDTFDAKISRLKSVLSDSTPETTQATVAAAESRSLEAIAGDVQVVLSQFKARDMVQTASLLKFFMDAYDAFQKRVAIVQGAIAQVNGQLNKFQSVKANEEVEVGKTLVRVTDDLFIVTNDNQETASVRSLLLALHNLVPLIPTFQQQAESYKQKIQALGGEVPSVGAVSGGAAAGVSTAEEAGEGSGPASGAGGNA